MKISTKILIAVLIAVAVSALIAILFVKAKEKKAVKAGKIKLGKEIYPLGPALPKAIEEALILRGKRDTSCWNKNGVQVYCDTWEPVPGGKKFTN